ncbi:MAG: DUF6441 family protein, partial [Janthinobacterium lividum]
GFLTAALRDTTAGLKEELRGQVTAAGMGNRLANTWRGNTYPQSRDSLDPATYVYSNAPAIIDAFSRGVTIRPAGGKQFLWLPTKNVPRSRSRGSRSASPQEVEAQFNQDLIIRRWRSGRMLAFVDTDTRKRGAKRSAVGLTAKQKLLLMFVLVPSVRVAKRFDLDAAANGWAGRFPQLLAARWR